MDLNKLTLGDKIVAATGIVLLITLVVLPWHSIDLCEGLGDTGGLGISCSFKRTAIQSPNGFFGLLALLLTIAIVAAVLIRKLTTTDLPTLPVGWGKAIFFGSLAALALLLLKLVIETTALGFGSYLAILLAAGMAYGGFLLSKEDDVVAPGGGTAPPTPF
ncbi:MAG: hypothetical protein M3527_04395 [Actinomycetota bacterium]|nr:hypothetical protein [Acidimicrobiia bacterium]MDQ3293673.1 hypothetical protein [Actinomycetota bacterium]